MGRIWAIAHHVASQIIAECDRNIHHEKIVQAVGSSSVKNALINIAACQCELVLVRLSFTSRSIQTVVKLDLPAHRLLSR